RDAPALDIIRLFQNEGARVRAYDPAAMEHARTLLTRVEFASSPAGVAAGAHALVVVTEWEEFKHLDFGTIRDAMAYPLLIDGRNMFNPPQMASLGFIYRGVGLAAELSFAPRP